MEEKEEEKDKKIIDGKYVKEKTLDLEEKELLI